MIYDHIDNLTTYFPGPESTLIHNFLNNLPDEDGKYELDGEKLFAIVSSYFPREFEEGQYEAHFTYLDLQIMVKGLELIYYHPICDLDLETTQKENDVALYKKTEKGFSFPISTTMFSLLYPQDGHLPSVAVKGDQKLRKVVFKIKHFSYDQ